MTTSKIPTINEHIIRISGKVNTDVELLLGMDYSISIKGQVVKIEEIDNHDGTKNLVYVIKPEILLSKEEIGISPAVEVLKPFM